MAPARRSAPHIRGGTRLPAHTADGVLAPHQQGLFKTELQGTQLWLLFERIDGHDVVLPSEVSESWKSRLGQYSLPQGEPREFFESAELRQGEGFLILDIYSAMLGETSTLMLRPEGEERAIVLGLGRGKGEVVRFERKGEAQFLNTKGIRMQLKPAVQSPGSTPHPRTKRKNLKRGVSLGGLRGFP